MDQRTLSLALLVAGIMIQTFNGFVGPQLGLQPVALAWITALAATLSAGILVLLRYLPSPEQAQKAGLLVQRNQVLYDAVAHLSGHDPENRAGVEASIIRSAGRPPSVSPR